MVRDPRVRFFKQPELFQGKAHLRLWVKVCRLLKHIWDQHRVEAGAVCERLGRLSYSASQELLCWGELGTDSCEVLK